MRRRSASPCCWPAGRQEDIEATEGAYPSMIFPGTVTAIALAAIQQEALLDGKIVRVRTTIQNNSMLLRSQMTGHAKIYSASARSWS